MDLQVACCRALLLFVATIKCCEATAARRAEALKG